MSFEGFLEVVGERVGGCDRLPSGLDLNGAVAAGGLDESPDGPACLRLDLAADGKRGEDDRQVASMESRSSGAHGHVTGRTVGRTSTGVCGSNGAVCCWRTREGLKGLPSLCDLET